MTQQIPAWAPEKGGLLTPCPKCFGPLQKTVTVDSDDNPINISYDCKRIYKMRRKKGCGYRSFHKSFNGGKL